MATWFVLGAGSDLAGAIATELASGSAKRVIIAGRHETSAPGVEFLACPDLVDGPEVAKLLEVAGSIEPPVGVVLCLGSFVGRRKLHRYRAAETAEIFDTNVGSFLSAYAAFLPLMIDEAEGGVFVTFGSVAERYNYPRLGPFTAAKRALHSLVMTAAHEQHGNDVHFLHLRLATLDTVKEEQFARRGAGGDWLAPADVATTIQRLVAAQGPATNKLEVDLYVHWSEYYAQGYLQRVLPDEQDP